MDIPVVNDPNVPKPASLIAKEADEKRNPGSASPSGWWSLTDLTGSLPGVSQAVQNAPDVPAHWKAAILADLKARCSGDLNFVYLDAHFFLEQGKAVLHYDLQATKVL